VNRKAKWWHMEKPGRLGECESQSIGRPMDRRRRAEKPCNPSLRVKGGDPRRWLLLATNRRQARSPTPSLGGWKLSPHKARLYVTVDPPFTPPRALSARHDTRAGTEGCCRRQPEAPRRKGRARTERSLWIADQLSLNTSPNGHEDLPKPWNVQGSRGSGRSDRGGKGPFGIVAPSTA
jgi:hypothetical protein